MNEQNPRPRGRPPKARPVEPAPEQQLEKIMGQIKYATVTDVIRDAIFPPPEVQSGGFVEDVIVHPTIDYTKAGELTVSDIVQVVNPNSVNYGVIFIVGDIKGGLKETKVHGFYLQPGAKKEFITVNINDLKNDGGLAIYGEARIKSRNPVSQQWKDEHGQPN